MPSGRAVPGPAETHPEALWASQQSSRIALCVSRLPRSPLQALVFSQGGIGMEMGITSKQRKLGTVEVNVTSGTFYAGLTQSTAQGSRQAVRGPECAQPCASEAPVLVVIFQIQQVFVSTFCACTQLRGTLVWPSWQAQICRVGGAYGSHREPTPGTLHLPAPHHSHSFSVHSLQSHPPSCSRPVFPDHLLSRPPWTTQLPQWSSLTSLSSLCIPRISPHRMLLYLRYHCTLPGLCPEALMTT